MRRTLLSLICLGWTALLSAQSALTTVTGTYVGPGGSNPSGTLTITWQRTQNDANPRQTIFPGRATYTITNGVIPNIQLFPNSVMLPAGTCYGIAAILNGISSQRYWTVPVSATPIDVGLVEGNIPCSNQPGPIVAPGQISSGGATVGQVLTWNGTYWSPAAGGGGGGSPGGTSGQIQYNSSGSFAGFTMQGDCTLASIPNIICTKTNGVSFATSATTDTTNAGNISSGVLAPARGGTGAGIYSQGTVPFVGAVGVYQSNASITYDLANFRLTLSSAGAIPSNLRLDNTAGGNQAIISFYDSGTEKFQLGKQTTNSFYILDSANSRDAFRIVAGNVLLDPIGGNTLIGGTVDGGYRADVQSGNNTLRVYNQTVGGSTLFGVRAGPTQSVNPLISVSNNAGTAMSQIGPDGCLNELSGASRTAIVCNNLMGLSSSAVLGFGSATAWDSGSTVAGLSLISSGLIGVGNGTAADFSGSLKLANITLTGSGFTGGGVIALCVDNTGLITTSGCPGGGGGGTVTHTTGPLTAGRLVLGNGSNDITVLGSSGTTTTLYHGNAGGAGSFSAVSLTADVSGILPFANGGTGTNTNFTNHFFFGNSTGGAAAPVAVQPTFADLAAGTVGARGTFPGGNLFCGGVNAQTGTSYTIATTDECKLTTFNNASATAATLQQATTPGFTSGAYFLTYNIGAGTVTITPTTSTINGASTLVLTQGQGAWIHSDGTNYSAWASAAPTGGGTVTQIIFSSPLSGGTITTTGTVGCATCVTSAAALTSNNLLIGGGLQASSALGSLGTTTTVLHGNAGGAPSFSAVSLTADVTGVLPNANTTAASANTASAIVTRDGSGNFSAGTITATVTGHSSLDLPLTGGTLTGNLLFTDATYDIGASGATRPRDFFLSRNALMGGTLGVTGLITATAGIASGSSPPATSVCTEGSAGMACFAAGTTPTGTFLGVGIIWENIANNRLELINNNSTSSAIPTLISTDAFTNKTYNGLTVSTTTGTFTLTNGKTFAVTNGLTLSGTDSTTMTFPGTSQTIPGMNQANTAGSSMTWDLSAGSVTAGLKVPSAAGAIPTADGFVAMNTTNHTHVWGSNGTTMVGAIAATGTGTATTCTGVQAVQVISSLAIPTCAVPTPASHSISADYTAVIGDADTFLYHPSADTSTRTWTIPANASVAYPVNTCLSFFNDASAGSLSIAITSDTLIFAGAGTTGTRTLTANGVATACKMTSTRWIINGAGLT